MDQLETAVVLIIFNRPDTTEKVLEAIAQARPSRLFVIADGPRPGRQREAEKCETARAIIERIDWDCEVIKDYSPVNMGLQRRITSGLDKVFQAVNEAIILEDDCLTEPTFFRYCHDLLVRYRDEKQVMMIGGNNFQFGRQRSGDSYYFSRYFHIWGWATWRRAWQQFDRAMSDWPVRRDQGWLEGCPWLNSRAVKYWQRIFQLTYDNQIDSWAYRWLYTGWKQDGLAVTPQHNLVSNIGFGSNATHTRGGVNFLANMPIIPLTLPLRHPPMISPNIAADRFTQDKLYSLSQWEKVRRRVQYYKSRMAEKGA